MKLVHLFFIITALCITQPAAPFNRKHYACVAGVGATALAASIVYDWQTNPNANKNLLVHAGNKLSEFASTNPITFAKNNKLIAASIYSTALTMGTMKGRDYRALQINRNFEQAINDCNASEITRAIKSGANPNQPIRSAGVTNRPYLPLEYVASDESNDNLDALQALIAAGCDVNGLDAQGDPIGYLSPLIHAAKSGTPQTIQALVAAGAQLEHRAAGRLPSTPLMWAILHTNDKAVSKLIELGADVATTTGDFGTPLWGAIEQYKKPGVAKKTTSIIKTILSVKDQAGRCKADILKQNRDHKSPLIVLLETLADCHEDADLEPLGEAIDALIEAGATATRQDFTTLQDRLRIGSEPRQATLLEKLAAIENSLRAKGNYIERSEKTATPRPHPQSSQSSAGAPALAPTSVANADSTQRKPSAAASTNLTLRTQPQTRRPKIKPTLLTIIPRKLSPEADFFEGNCKEQLLSILNLQAHAIVSEADKELLRRKCFYWMYKSGNTNRIIGSLINILNSRENNRATIRNAIETYE